MKKKGEDKIKDKGRSQAHFETSADWNRRFELSGKGEDEHKIDSSLVRINSGIIILRDALRNLNETICLIEDGPRPVKGISEDPEIYASISEAIQNLPSQLEIKADEVNYCVRQLKTLIID